jgi:16S rRNA (cytidine1402-2'-O)-methyltransferase
MTAPGTLYLVPNLLGAGDPELAIPPAVRNIVLGLDYFIVETPKAARAFLKVSGTAKPLQELRIEAIPGKPESASIKQLLAPLTTGGNGGLISDAGVPAVADPGALVVREAHRLGIKVVPLVGPSSILLALMASGLQGQRFAFHGYLPVEEARLIVELKRLETESARHDQTQVFIETPYRNERMLKVLCTSLQPSTQLCVAADLTLPSEEVTTRGVAQWRSASPPKLKDRPSVFLFCARPRS